MAYTSSIPYMAALLRSRYTIPAVCLLGGTTVYLLVASRESNKTLHLFRSKSKATGELPVGLSSSWKHYTRTTPATSEANVMYTTNVDRGDSNVIADIGSREECPMCKEYLAGPCGAQFQTWLDCTDQNKEDYVPKCRTHFDALHQCLDLQDEVNEDHP